MIVDGETYACDACIRGHRARSCEHHGRPLQPIRKKGRPASQCGHCRSMRKSRSAHVKCDCGKRARDAQNGSASPQGSKSKCNCFEDGKCKCAHKQEPLTLVTVPPGDSQDSPSTSVPSGGDSSCCGGPDATPSLSLLDFEEPGHFGSDAWQNNDLFQLDKEHPHRMFDNLGAEWQGSLVQTALEDPQGWTSSAFHELDIPQLPLDLSNLDGAGNLRSPLFDGFLGTSQDILNDEVAPTSVDWAPGEVDLLRNGIHDQIAGSADEPMWLEGPDQSTGATSTFSEQAGAAHATAPADLPRGAAPR